MKKSQVTIFLLLGIVVAIIFGFLFYTLNKVAKGGIEQDADKIYDDFLRATQIKSHVQACLRESTKQGIRLAALQGGRIYDNQIGKDTKDPELVMYFSFNKNKADFTDDHALENSGQLNNAAWTFQGRFEGAYVFDGNSCIRVRDDDSLDFGADEDFTLMAWVKTKSQHDQAILAKGNYGIKIKDGLLQCSISDGTDISVSTTYSVTDGLWHHALCSFDRSDSLVLLVDSFLRDSRSIAGIGDINNNEELLIGKDNIGNFFNGTIDEVAVYSEAVDQREAFILFNKRIITEPITANDVVPYKHEDGFYDVSYGIKAPVADINEFNPAVPDYPYPGSLITNPPEKFGKDYISLFSYYNRYFPALPRLCNPYGPNIYSYPNASFSCETYDYSLTNTSIQTMLKDYILNKTKECVNFEQLAGASGYDITDGDLTGDVLFGEEHVFVSLNYPIEIRLREEQPSVRFLESFDFSLNVRFKKLHELAQHLIRQSSDWKSPEADADNIFFDITQDPRDCDCRSLTFCLPCKAEGITVEKENNYCVGKAWSRCNELDRHYKHSHILKISDKGSMIDGKPLTFLFAIENRIPVLDYIKDISVDYWDDARISPAGIDPDEEEVTFSYEGWKTPVSYGVDAVYETDEDDAGEHVVRVKVADSEGLYDYQDVVIEVS